MPDLLVVGLGNPGRAYAGTFHNAGRAVAERFAEKRGGSFRETVDALVATVPGAVVLLPETFMNLSGRAVAPYARRRGIPPASVLAVVDDLHIATGRVRIRTGGSSGGHNGLKSLAEHLGTEEFPRVRIGIGPDPGGEFREKYVLSRPRPEVMSDMMRGLELGLSAVEAILERGLTEAMNIFNA